MVFFRRTRQLSQCVISTLLVFLLSQPALAIDKSGQNPPAKKSAVAEKKQPYGPKTPIGKYRISVWLVAKSQIITPDEIDTIDEVDLKLRINQKGETESVAITKKSKIEAYNTAALDAIKQSRFPPFPSTIKEPVLDLDITLKFAPPSPIRNYKSSN